jgi:hypothetical protein
MEGHHMSVVALPLPVPRPRVTFRDDTAPHQIRIFKEQAGSKIAVSCTCRASGYGIYGPPHYEPLEARVLWEPGEAIAVWREHYELEGSS